MRVLLSLLLLLQLSLAPVVHGMAGEQVGVIRDENGKILGKEKDWEGSFQHAFAGCAAAEATGADCAAGAAGGMAQSLYAGSLNGAPGDPRIAQRLGTFTGLVFSGDDPANVSVGSNFASSGFIKNYLKHYQLEDLYGKMLDCEQAAEPWACRGLAYKDARDQSDANFAELEACGRDQECINGHIQTIERGHEVRSLILSTNWTLDPRTSLGGVDPSGTRDAEAIYNTLFDPINPYNGGVESQSFVYILNNSKKITPGDWEAIAFTYIAGCGEFCIGEGGSLRTFKLGNRGTGLLTPSGNRQTGATNSVLDVPGRVQSRVNLANGSTRFTPLNDAGNPVQSGWGHVTSRHFGGNNTQSQFTLSQSEVRGILQSDRVVSAPVSEIKMINGTPTYVRTVDVGRPIGTVRQSDGGGVTTNLYVQTDSAGNLISAFPVP